MNLARLAGIYAVVATVLAAALATAVLAGPYRAIERSDYMTYHVAARIILAGDGDCLYDAACQAEAQQQLIGDEPTFQGGALPFNSPPWLATLVVPLGWLSLSAGFAIFTAFGVLVLVVAALRLAPGSGFARLLGPLLLLTAWPTVIAFVRGQSTLLVVGLLGLSVALSRYRSGAAMGLAALKPTLVPAWAAWQLLTGHW
ncbi:MAG TPA: glycosyltransferase 87 family protein, partial [Candidatus Limnocylindrales bacterium]|nr:glycosyltransferase 87 family protein [Candidatus Limnocylindrales bacterium]